jgi:hypothetical protein
MNHICREIAAYCRACEGLLSKEGTLTEDERSLVEYYVNELLQQYLSDKPTVRLRYNESGSVEPSSATQATAK